MAKDKEQKKDIVITKVRNKRDSIEIEWTEGIDPCKRTFHDNPLKAFYDAIEALTPHVITLCEFPAGYAKGIEATGITVREKGDNTLALITAKKKLKRNGRVLNIPTPLLAMYEDAEDKGADHMSEAEAAAIENVIKQTKKYLAGDRAQGQIVFESPTPEKKDDDKTEPFPGLTEQ